MPKEGGLVRGSSRTDADMIGFAGIDGIIGCSEAIRMLKAKIRRFSKVDFSLLITGESGSGKELVAHAVHLLSVRKFSPFVPVNSAAIPEHLIESELFGFCRGAFTGADTRRLGLIECASGGTLFLDEIADIPLSLQAKFLRVLQERRIRPLGENMSREVDIRLMCATNKDLPALIRRGEFREDLYFRIQDLQVNVPPLRARMEDIPLLTRHFLKKNGFRIPGKTEFSRLLSYLNRFDWPGNVRQLESRIKRLMTFYPDLEEGSSVELVAESGFMELRDSFERFILLRALNENCWNRTRTALNLKISRVYLSNLIRKHKLKKSGKK